MAGRAETDNRAPSHLAVTEKNAHKCKKSKGQGIQDKFGSKGARKRGGGSFLLGEILDGGIDCLLER